MADVDMGGTPTVFVGSRQLGAFGLNGAIVSGDDVPPQVIEITPMGWWDETFSDVEVVFTEPMLDSMSAELLLAAVQLTGPDGESTPWVDASWSSDGTILTLTLDTTAEASDGTWLLEIFDELRDEAGNRQWTHINVQMLAAACKPRTTSTTEIQTRC